jgi:hypothetical protein
MRRINGHLGNVDVSRQEDALAHGDKVAYPSIQGIEKVHAEAVTTLVSICWAVDTDEHKGWELKYDASPFGVECRGIDVGV